MAFWKGQLNKDISEKDALLIKEIASNMLKAFYPSSKEWKVVYHSNHYLIGCDIPRDVKITIAHMYQIKDPRVSNIWVEWNRHGFSLVSKVYRKAPGGVKRKLLKNDPQLPLTSSKSPLVVTQMLKEEKKEVGTFPFQGPTDQGDHSSKKRIRTY